MPKHARSWSTIIGAIMVVLFAAFDLSPISLDYSAISLLASASGAAGLG